VKQRPEKLILKEINQMPTAVTKRKHASLKNLGTILAYFSSTWPPGPSGSKGRVAAFVWGLIGRKTQRNSDDPYF
jgi:hypothetical protein